MRTRYRELAARPGQVEGEYNSSCRRQGYDCDWAVRVGRIITDLRVLVEAYLAYLHVDVRAGRRVPTSRYSCTLLDTYEYLLLIARYRNASSSDGGGGVGGGWVMVAEISGEVRYEYS